MDVSTDLSEERSERDVYITKLHEERQNNIVNFKSAASTMSTVLTWSHRTTSCDVISTITTTVQMKNGDMKDIKMYSNNIKFKAPSKKSSMNMYQSPLEHGTNQKRTRKMCCEILHKEKNEFMSQLHSVRTKRATLETIAAIIIQTIFRGFIVRRQADAIRSECSLRKLIHGSLVKFVAENNLPPMATRGELRQVHIAKRFHAACVLQCAFRCYMSKNYTNRRRYEHDVDRMNREAEKIQNMARLRIAKSTVDRKRERSALQKRALGALMIQSQVRMLLSRRKVAVRRFKLHWLAARMIQGCFRGRNTRKCMAVYLAAQEKVKFFRGARGMQQVIRGRIGRSRVNRIKLRCLYIKIFRAAARIQAMIRKFLAVIRVRKCREEKKSKDRIRADAILAMAAKNDAKEAEELGQSMDIFHQTRVGATSNVDALYHSDIEGSVSAEDIAQVTNDLGDTILSQAAKCNHLDILRKCINWGYDVNHENALGESVIALAAGGGHMSVVTYMLSDSQRNAAAILAALPKKEKQKKKKPRVNNVQVEKTEEQTEQAQGEDSAAAGGAEGRQDATFLTGQNEDGDARTGSSSDQTQPQPQQDQQEEEEEEEEEEEVVAPEIKSSKVLRLTDDDKGSILTAAAKHADITHLKMIVENSYMTDLNAVHPLTTCTALHVACELGHEEHVDFLLKSGARFDVKDDNGQLPLHKAARGSLAILKKLLELSRRSVISKEGDIKALTQQLLLVKDADGKDCFIIASLLGQTDIVDFIKDSVDMSARVVSDEVGWSPNDISSTLRVVESGNLPCLKNIISEGFDSAWCPEESGVTIAMMACQHARTDIIDYLLTEVGADFSACDQNGKNSLHYAAEVTRKDIIPLLLSAGGKAKSSCNLSPSLLAAQDKSGQTPVHCIAQHGSTLSIDLLAQDAVATSVLLKDNEGFTPLLTACKHKQSNKIAELLKLGADATVVDNKGNNALWHYAIQVTSKPAYAIAVNPTIELDIMQSLLKAGCTLFNSLTSSSSSALDLEKAVSDYVAFFGSNRNKLCSADQESNVFEQLVSSLQPTDVAALESNLSFFNVLPPLLSPIDCWRAALSAMFFHPDVLTIASQSAGGSNKCLASLFDGHAAPVLRRLDEEKGGEEGGAAARECEDQGQGQGESSADGAVVALQSVLHDDLSLAGWAILARNEAALMFLLRKGMSAKAPVDRRGNNCLHWAVQCDSAKIVYSLLDTTAEHCGLSDDVLIIESVNGDGLTAAMLGARAGAFASTKAVIQMGASARRALTGKYWGWLLAMAKQVERREINSQTGIYGDDDERYFPLHPNHNLMYD